MTSRIPSSQERLTVEICLESALSIGRKGSRQAQAMEGFFGTVPSGIHPCLYLQGIYVLVGREENDRVMWQIAFPQGNANIDSVSHINVDPIDIPTKKYIKARRTMKG
jgi:hypothetical protein